MSLEAVIGLEIHVQLGTRSKLFCACPVEFGGHPNSRICPVCTGQPGALPVLNEAALRLAVQAGLALHCDIGEHTRFDRKNYFYPDLPKGYQISQLDFPVARGGWLEFEMEEGSRRRAGIQRAHLEEDAGKAIHPPGEAHSLVDLNRAGVPLIEIVGEPDLRTPEEAAAYLTAMRRTLRHASVSDCDMEKGSMRCDANISIRPAGQTTLGTKVEVKNMNSIRNVERALQFEFRRQCEVQAGGGQIVQETRSFRDDEGTTISMRVKEEADDYRYFPDPDLPQIAIPPALVEQARAGVGESYFARRDRFEQELGLGRYDAGVLAEERDLATWFEATVTAGLDAKSAANWIQGEILAFLNEQSTELEALAIGPPDLAELGQLVGKGQLSHQAGKKVLRHMLEHGGSAAAATDALDLAQIQDTSTLATAVDEVVAAEEKIVADYRAGKGAALNALLGRVMRACKGKGDPQIIRDLLRQRLDVGPES